MRPSSAQLLTSMLALVLPHRSSLAKQMEVEQAFVARGVIGRQARFYWMGLKVGAHCEPVLWTMPFGVSFYLNLRHSIWQLTGKSHEAAPAAAYTCRHPPEWSQRKALHYIMSPVPLYA